MIQDKQLLFSVAQADTTQTEHPSANYVDLTKIGDAEDANYVVVVQVNTTVTSEGAATVQVKVQTSNDTTNGTDGAWATLIATDAFALAALTAGSVLVQANIPRPVQRFLRVTYTVATADLTAGKFDAFITPNVQTQFNQ